MVFSTSCRATSNLCRGCAAGQSRGLQALNRGILHSRRHLAASPVFKGIPNFRETRIAMLRAETVDELFAILERAREAVRQVTD